MGAPWWARSGRASREAPFCEQSSALTSASFDVLRSAVFFYIKSPLRVEEAGLQELIPTTWWPHSGREVGGPRGVAGSVRARPGCPSPPPHTQQRGPFLSRGPAREWGGVAGGASPGRAPLPFLPAPAQGKDGKEAKDETAEQRQRRRAYERGCQRLKKRIEGQVLGAAACVHVCPRGARWRPCPGWARGSCRCSPTQTRSPAPPLGA